MIEYSKKLSKDFKFVRVDLYELENEVRLGELTFIPMNSFFYCKNKNDEIEIGKNIIIKDTKKIWQKSKTYYNFLIFLTPTKKILYI